MFRNKSFLIAFALLSQHCSEAEHPNEDIIHNKTIISNETLNSQKLYSNNMLDERINRNRERFNNTLTQDDIISNIEAQNYYSEYNYYSEDLAKLNVTYYDFQSKYRKNHTLEENPNEISNQTKFYIDLLENDYSRLNGSIYNYVMEDMKIDSSSSDDGSAYIDYDVKNYSSIEFMFSLNTQPDYGRIPTLNRKAFQSYYTTVLEHPYIVSIRRNLTHYLVGSLVTLNTVITIAHKLYGVPTYELSVVLGTTHSDRGPVIRSVILVVLHPLFSPTTLQNDIALVRFYRDVDETRMFIKLIRLIPPLPDNFLGQLAGSSAFVTGWGRCDFCANVSCLPRSSKYYPNEYIDPILRTISFEMVKEYSHCSAYLKNGIEIPKGVLCLGPSRQNNLMAPCLAAPGAPLVINGSLLGILSWGFGCGYRYDQPLVYTDVRHFFPWLSKTQKGISSMRECHAQPLYAATRSYVTSEFMHERRDSPDVHREMHMNASEFRAKNLDWILSAIDGSVYDFRNFMFGKKHHDEKVQFYTQYAPSHPQDRYKALNCD